MPATPRRVEITAEDLASAKRGPRDYDYNDIEVPGDYEAILEDVNDHTKGENVGWKFTFSILGCPFDEYVMLTKASRWKFVQTMTAFGYPLAEGIDNFDPNAFIGTSVGATVDWQKDPEQAGDGPNYREIKALFPLTEELEADQEEPEVL